MSRFEQLVVSDRRDRYGIHRPTGTVIVNVDEIATVHDATVDTTYRAALDSSCPAGIFACVRIRLRSREQHTLMLGQFPTEREADQEINRFTSWLTGAELLTNCSSDPH